jgi:long-chain fatty acid transport protein
MAINRYSTTRILFAVLSCMALLAPCQLAFGQGFGVELGNTLMPASGGMGGTSIAQPQDLISAINGNPATMSQFRGTQFTFGGAWVEPTINLEHTGSGLLPGLGPFSGKSATPGSSLGNIGVTQDFRALGRPVTAGVALVSVAGLGVDYSNQPNSNNSAITLQILKLQPGVSVQMTDRLSIGANFGLGIGAFDGLFVGSSKSTSAYAVRGTVGVSFDVTPQTKFGAYYQTEEHFNFKNAITLQPFAGLPGLPVNVNADLPQNVAIGIANSSLAGGRLLLAADLTYRFWEEAALFDAVYTNQFTVQLGAQYTTNRAKFRVGYVWAEDAMLDVPGNVIAGITPPGAANAIQYIQGLAPNFNQHRLSGGIGIPNVLPGIDMDTYIGGMFKGSDTFGQTSASVMSYYVGGGLTWRFGRGSGCELAPNNWCN